MTILVHLDIMLARRKVTGRELAHAIGITEQNLSVLRSGRVKGIRFGTLSAICDYLKCQPGDLLEFVSGSEPAESGADDE